MPSTRRERLVEAAWPFLQATLPTDASRRPLRTALRGAATLSSGHAVFLVESAGEVPGADVDADFILQQRLAVPLDQILVRPLGETMPLVARVKVMVDSFLELERDVLSRLIAQSVEVTHHTVEAFPGELLARILASRTRLGQGPLDLLLSASNIDRLQATADAADGVRLALRGGQILPVATRPDSDGLIVPQLKGVAAAAEIEPIALEWDVRGDGGIEFAVTERLRWWHADPRAPAIDLAIADPRCAA